MGKTDFDCQIYNIEGRLEMGENLFAFNLLTDWNFLKISSQFYTKL